MDFQPYGIWFVQPSTRRRGFIVRRRVKEFPGSETVKGRAGATRNFATRAAAKAVADTMNGSSKP